MARKGESVTLSLSPEDEALPDRALGKRFKPTLYRTLKNV